MRNYLLVTDETNRDPSDESRFFIYGGCIVPTEEAPKIHQSIESIRMRAGYPADIALKFDSRSRPNAVTIEVFTNMKKAVVELARDHGVKFIAELILHDIIRDRSYEERVLFALKTLCSQFQIFLLGADGFGQVVSDRTEHILDLFKEIHCRGVQPRADDGGFEARLTRIWQFSVSSTNCGHLMSMVDIILGSFRFCINRPTADVSRTMFDQLLPLLPGVPTQEDFQDGTGLLLRPKHVEVRTYIDEYSRLRRDIVALVSGGTRTEETTDDERAPW